MKIFNKDRSKKKPVIIAVIVLILILLIGWYLIIYKGSVFGWSLFNSPKTTNGTNLDAPTDEQIKNGTVIKDNSIKSGGKSGSDQPTEPTQIPGSSKKSIVLSLTHASQSSPGADLQIGVLIGASVDSGTCTLTLTSPGKSTITQTSGVSALSSSSVCQGFDVANVPKGNWQITVEFDNGELTGLVKSSQEVL